MPQKSCLQTVVAACQRKHRTVCRCDLCPGYRSPQLTHTLSVCLSVCQTHSDTLQIIQRSVLPVPFTAQTTNTLQISLVSSTANHRSGLWKPRAQTLVLNSRFFLFWCCFYFKTKSQRAKSDSTERKKTSCFEQQHSIIFSSGNLGFLEGLSTLFRLKSLACSTYHNYDV